MEKDKIVYDFYGRKSQEDEDRQVLSLEAQEKECREFASKNGIKVRKFWLESFSAKEPGREKFNALMLDVEQGLVNGILSWHPDRLSRNSVDGGKLIYHLDKGLLKDLQFPTYHFDNTPQGKWMLNIQFGQSKYYVDALSVNVKRGNRMKLEKGWRPGTAATGYLNDKVEKTIIADPDRFSLMQRAFRSIIDGQLTPVEALEKLNNQWGYRTLKTKRMGGRPLANSSFYRILSNPFYCGIIVSNGKEYPGRHPKMISEEDFDKLQVILGKKGKARPQKHDFALTGAIRCGECGSMVTAETKSKLNRTTNNVETYTYYRCSKKNKNIKCTQAYIRDFDLEHQVDTYLEGISIHEDFKNWALKYLDYANQNEAKTEELSFEGLHKLQEDSRKQLRNLTQLRIKEQIDEELYIEEKERIAKEINHLEELLAETNRQADQWVELTEETFNFACYAREHFKNGDSKTKREIFSKIGSNFTLKDKVLGLDLNKQYFAFTKEFEQDFERLEMNKKRLNSLEKDGLRPKSDHWLGDRDSNPGSRFQRPLSYH